MTQYNVNIKGINTRLAHSWYDPHGFHGFVNPPVVHASTVLHSNAATMAARAQKYTYGTRGTPTSDVLCAAIDEFGGFGWHHRGAIGIGSSYYIYAQLPVVG